MVEEYVADNFPTGYGDVVDIVPPRATGQGEPLDRHHVSSNDCIRVPCLSTSNSKQTVDAETNKTSDERSETDPSEVITKL